MLPLPAVCFGSGGGGFAFGAGFGFAFGLLLFSAASHSCFVLTNFFCFVFSHSFATFICFVALGLGGSGAGAGAGSCPGFGADFAIAFALGRLAADFGGPLAPSGPKVSASPRGFGKESFCIDFPQPLPFAEALLFLPSSVRTIIGAGPSIPSGCRGAGDLVFGPTDFALCRSLAIVLTFVGGDGS